MNARDYRIEDYDYELPENRIAQYPLQERSDSKLLLFKNKDISERTYKEIDTILPPFSLLIGNNTKVVQARLMFQTQTGASIEIFCLEPFLTHVQPLQAMLQTHSIEYRCMIGKASKWKDKVLFLNKGGVELQAHIVQRDEQGFVIRFVWFPPDLSFAEILQALGNIPIPPYLHRKSEQVDLLRYQTTYALHEGSVAAPTAGLHFTPELFSRLQNQQIETQYVTLHVGAGTFKPIKSSTLGDHDMHAEWIDVHLDVLENIIKKLVSKTNIIALGTTSLRTIESLYWMGVKCMNAKLPQNIMELEVKQWDAYELPEHIPAHEALSALLNWLRHKGLQSILCKTQLLIVPHYNVRIADVLITNFHQPRSTLLLLVASFIGEAWRKVYDYALQHEFRFLSYGDGCVLFKRS